MLCVAMSQAAIPANYYASVNGLKSPDAILSTLHGIIDDHEVIGYSGLEPYYAQTDMDSTGNHIWDMYSKCEFTMEDANCSQKNVCDCWNKEHSVPQSWFNEGTPMKSDLFHVIPTDARVNNFRSNYAYGETSSTAYIDKDPSALGRLGSCNFTGYTGTVYEPDDQYKGDFARIYFYMATRYLDKNLAQSTGNVMFSYSNSKLSLTTYSVNLLLKWHRQDPVSQKEIDRNNAVFGIQENRNPYVDYPYLAEYVWGTQKSVQVDLANDFVSSEDPLFIPGVSDGSMASIVPTIRCASSVVAFPTLLEGMEDEKVVTIHGANLTGAISATVSGTDAALFSVEPAYIAAASANGQHDITITYSPTAIGKHNAILTFSSTDATDVVINLSGACAEESVITWKVDGQVYTVGSPTTAIAAGGIITNLPTAPASCSEVSSQFVGWTQYLINDTTNDVPADLFSDAADAPTIVENVTFHAVFAQMYVDSGSAPVTDSIEFAKKYSKDTEIKSETIGKTRLSFALGNSKNQAKFFKSDGAVRVYAQSRMDFIGTNIIKIVLTYGAEDHSNEITASTGTFSVNTWTGKTDSVSLIIGGNSKHRRITKIVVTTQEKVEEYKYRRFMTSCTASPMGVDEVAGCRLHALWAVAGRKVMREGRLVIEVNGVRYNVLGVREP